MTTVSDFKIVEPFAGDEPLTITAVATHDATLALRLTDQQTARSSETGTLSDINAVLQNGIVYTPSCLARQRSTMSA